MNAIALRINCFALGLLTCSMFSCAKTSNPGGPQDSGFIFPLKTGNYWVSQHETYDSLGTLRNAFVDTLRVVGDTMINSERWYYFLEGAHGFYTNRADGHYGYVAAWSPQPFLDLKYPAQQGDTYSIPYALGIREVVSTGASITVPAGTFTCYQYRSPYPNNWQWNYYYTPGVGLILSSGVRRSQGGSILQTSRMTLLQYFL